MKKQDRVEQPTDRAVAIKERAAKLHQEWQEEAKQAEQARALEEAERQLTREEAQAALQRLEAERERQRALIMEHYVLCQEAYVELLAARDQFMEMAAATPSLVEVNAAIRDVRQRLGLREEPREARRVVPPWGMWDLDEIKALKPLKTLVGGG
ncbi:MAG: hypothetical protein ACYC5O_22805 [Anaerolineae bacterium]